MTLVYLSGAWIIGIFLGSVFALPPVFAVAALAPLIPLLFSRTHKKLLIITSLCILAFFAGSLRFQTSQKVDSGNLQTRNNSTVQISGMVASDPKISGMSTQVDVAATQIKLDGAWHQTSGRVLVFVPLYSNYWYRYGDVLDITGRLETPTQFTDFDYKGYLAQQGIGSTMLNPQISVTATGQGSQPLSMIYAFRSKVSAVFARVLPEPQASLAQGILLGDRASIPSSLQDAFSHSGTAHLLAISGMNLTIIAGILLSIGVWLFGRRYYLYVWLGLAVIWSYTILTGLQPPVVRGAVMASMFLAAELFGRQRSGLVAIFFAAAIMVGIDPPVLWQASFQLSFLAMAGLIFLGTSIQGFAHQLVERLPSQNTSVQSLVTVIADSFSVTLAALIVVWPLIAYYFGIIALGGPMATLLAMPVFPAITLLGVLTGGIGLVFLPLAQGLAWVLWLFLSYFLLIVNLFAAFYVQVGTLDSRFLWGYYVVLIVIVWTLSHRKQTGNMVAKPLTLIKSGIDRTDNLSPKLLKWSALGLLVVAVLTVSLAANMPDDKLHVSFLDVGQGDAILIQTPNHQDILIDGGPTSSAITTEPSKKMPFWDRTIDLVVMSHPDADHITGQFTVLSRYEVKQTLTPPPPTSTPPPLLTEWNTLVAKKNINRTVAVAGQQIDLGRGVTIEVLNPQEKLLSGTGNDDDNNGVVLRLSMGNVSFLFTGDIRQEAEDTLIVQRADLAATVLKVAHHGSNTSTSPEFLNVVNPQLAVISVGADNRFGHPTQLIMDRLSQQIGRRNIYLTEDKTSGKQATVEFITDGERLWVR